MACVAAMAYQCLQESAMLQAVLVTESGDEGAFLDRLKSNGWILNVASASTAVQAVQQSRPVLIILDNKLADVPALSK